jgi:glycogen(starch) synthase
VRALVVSEFFRPFVGGIEVLADQLLPALAARGHQIDVVTTHGPMPLPDEEMFGGVRVRRYPFRAVIEGKDPEGILLLRRRLGRLLAELDPDVIHLNGIAPSNLVLLPLLSGGHAVLVQLHQRLFEWEESQDSLAARLLARADWVLSVSAAALAQARALVPGIEARSTVIRNAVNRPEVAPSALSFTPPTLLCLGRLTPQKGFDLALRAAAALASRFPDLRLIIGGDGDERAPLQALSRSLGIEDRCEWRGWVRPGDVPALIDTASMLILSSRYEGLPLVAVEAAWMARPVVATRVGGMEEIVRDRETGLLIEPENVEALAAAIARLLEQPDAARRMGAAARRIVEREFGWEECVTAYDEVYRRLAGLAAARGGVV